jgi:hypothetical protein
MQCFTILYQHGDIPALEVCTAQGRWIAAPPIPGTLVIKCALSLCFCTHAHAALQPRRPVRALDECMRLCVYVRRTDHAYLQTTCSGRRVTAQ